MSFTCQFYVSGIAKPQPRPRAFARKMGDKMVARVYDAGTAEGWKSLVARAAEPYLPSDGPLMGAIGVRIVFNMPRPLGHYGSGKNFNQLKDSAPWFHTSSTGDLDNLAKSILDCLTTIGMWGDDSQIVSLDLKKHYAVRGHEGAAIEVFTLEKEEKRDGGACRLGTGAFREQFGELKGAVI